MGQRNITLERQSFFRQLRLTAGIPKRMVAAMPWAAVMPRERSVVVPSKSWFQFAYSLQLIQHVLLGLQEFHTSKNILKLSKKLKTNIRMIS